MANQKSLRYLNLLYTNLKWPLNVKLPEKLQRLRIGNSRKTVSPPEKKEAKKEGKKESALECYRPLAKEQDKKEDASAYFYPPPPPAKKEDKKEEKKGDASAYLYPHNIKEEEKPEPLPYFHPAKKPAEETKLRQSLGDLRQLKELEELILIGLVGAKCILWEEIAGPNMKVLVIRNCPIDTLNFKVQETMHVAMGALIDFTLTKTRISEICIPEGVLPSLETLDLSENSWLKQVKYLPSTLVRLNLQRCHRLKELINLSNLVNLKFLCINGCYQLETLNVEGLTSLEEIQAEGCTELKTLINLSNLVHLKFLLINRCRQLEALNVEGLTSLEGIRVEACKKLKSIQGLSQLERLKYLGLSSNTDVMWNDICNFLTSTSHEKLASAFFTGASTITYYDTDMVVRQSITKKFKVKVVDVVFPATPSAFNKGGSFKFHAKMKDFQKYGGILMCFLTISRGRDVFGVRFEASNDGTSANEYTINCGEDGRYEQKLHVFMWTEECGLFTDHKGYDTIGIYSHTMPLSKGWIIMVDKNIDVSQICKQMIIALSIA